MYSIKIQDTKGMHIGDRINVDAAEVKKYIDKDFVVIDISTGTPFSKEEIYDQIGVSDGLINEDNDE